MRTSRVGPIVIVLSLSAHAALAQCVKPPTTGPEDAWAQGAAVTVYIDPAMSAEWKNAVRTAFSNWAGAGGSSVTFGFQNDAERALHPPPGGSVGVTVRDLDPSEGGLTTGAPHDGHLDRATMVLNSGTTDPRAMLQTVAHEAGHTFGLDNCSYCPPGTSAMTGGTGLNDYTSGRDGPSSCDADAARDIAGYGGGPGPGPGPGGRPEPCTLCRVYDCEWTREDNSDSRECRYAYDQCCRNDAGASSEANPCAGWLPAQACEIGTICCIDPAVAYEARSCASRGWWEIGEQGACNAACGRTCASAEISVLDRNTRQPVSTTECWRCPAAPDPGPSCGAIGGDYCGSGGCPTGYDSLGTTYDCNPCCKSQPPPDPGPSCGAIGGDYCGSGGCPAGYAALGSTYDCNPCCKSQPPPDPGPSCGAIGGDYCGSGGCPGGYDSLGTTYDCDPCCKSQPPPECTPEGCPGWGVGWQPDGCGGWNWCGDPDPCGGDPCCGDPCCGDPCCGDPCCGDPCCGGPCEPMASDTHATSVRGLASILNRTARGRAECRISPAGAGDLITLKTPRRSVTRATERQK
jgi:hypothetical protein